VRLGHRIVVVSRRPGEIREVLEIDVPLEQRVERMAELERLQRQVWHIMREEARQADMELTDGA